jgi:hypothetical protein
MKQKFSFVSLVLCLMIGSGTRPSLAAPMEGEGSQPDSYTEMLKEGWKPVADGVLQRDRADGNLETFAFGSEGFTWASQQLAGQLERMQQEYAKYPSKKLARAINRQKAQITRVEQTGQVAEKSGELSGTYDKVIINGCDVAYGAHVNAFPLNGGGAGASSDAYFHNNCGLVGDTNAYAYSRATTGTTTNTQTTTDPRSNGTWYDSVAAANTSGSSDCYSEASANVTSGSLGIFYSISATPNYACNPPVPPVGVTIIGPAFRSVSGYNCSIVLWTASVSGGASPFSYTWYRDGYSVGNGSSYSETFCGGNFNFTETVNLSVSLSDGIGQSASDTHTTSVSYMRTISPCGGARICPEEPLYPNDLR